ncbi:Zn(II)2Cys6 transcription factor [Aspergillus heteromorphus CBS 117.55]|uniref:Zn(II)2Cys6 transcription factor n=1 Tax=Aspergillus heteromorphus CBS 117.55 TaxID=1448321 RepID=A0A317WM66_9EURO|nr:Zn(II)2Cys6 transcription factor [Aspergillus heteromorphus CBS 117.55]PWY86118.1 Zn(II)2Cys6 transcription factor [Aspergillus heteromorphus CBS 117.55]
MRRVKKSRNGCARCKSKRVKCGEERPHCSRCIRLGVICPGYVQSLRWVTKYPPSVPGESNQLAVGDTPDESRSIPYQQSASRDPETPNTPGFVDPLTQSLAVDDNGLGLTTPDDPVNPRGLELDGPNGICDNLWGLQQTDSLPELADLCPQSPISASASVSGSASQNNPDINFESPASHIEDPFGLFSLAAPALQDEPHMYSGFSPSTIVRQYPPPGMKPPQRDFAAIPQPLNNPSWTLIEYYFKEVAALFSSYDSQMNPFRSTVSRLWGSSLAMCRTMQSMAAATLVHDFPQFGPLGRKMRDEAVDIITKESTLDDKSLLALLMLGQTASWHDPKDLGISFFNLLRNHLDIQQAATAMPGRGNNHQFFEEALVYWEMLLSFVADDSTVLSGSAAAATGESLVLQRVPHPWTGIARDTQFTVQEVGRLVRRERARIRSRTFTSHADITQAQQAMEKAQVLEEQLLALAHPAEAEIVSPGDDETPVWHLLTMAEVYRCTGLMQLYRVFPDLLRRRLPSRRPSNHPRPQHPPTTIRDPFISPPTGSNTPWFCEPSYPHSHPHPHPTSPDQTPGSATTHPDSYYDTWLTEFALTTLSRLKTIPLESRTRCLQPFLLVASSSELRLPRLAPLETNLDSTGPSISSYAIDVSRTRRFILGRLTSYLHVLPPKPISVCLRLVREVWRHIDAGEQGVYWIDVMVENGWETTMG